MQWSELLYDEKEKSPLAVGTYFKEIMILAVCGNIIFMHIQKDIDLGHDLIKLPWKGWVSNELFFHKKPLLSWL